MAARIGIVGSAAAKERYPEETRVEVDCSSVVNGGEGPREHGGGEGGPSHWGSYSRGQISALGDLLRKVSNQASFSPKINQRGLWLCAFGNRGFWSLFN